VASKAKAHIARVSVSRGNASSPNKVGRSACSAGCNAQNREESAMRNGVEAAQCSNRRLTVMAKNEGRKSQIIQNYSFIETREKKWEKNSVAFFEAIFCAWNRRVVAVSLRNPVVLATLAGETVSRCNRPDAAIKIGLLLFKSIRLFHSSFLAFFFT
jgi:hypothetical protein